MDLIAPALGVLMLSAEAVGVSRALAPSTATASSPTATWWRWAPPTCSPGLSSGFVQSGGASQTAAAEGAGGRTQLTALVAAGLILLTGAFLGPLFRTCRRRRSAAIVIVAVPGFFDVAELRRFARVRRSAIVFAGLGAIGVLGLGVLQGLVVTAGLTLVYVVARLSRPSVAARARPRAAARGAGSTATRTGRPRGVLVVRSDGPLLYPNANAVKERVLALGRRRPRPPRWCSTSPRRPSSTSRPRTRSASSADALARAGVVLRLATSARRRSTSSTAPGVAERVPVAATLDDALADAADRRRRAGRASSRRSADLAAAALAVARGRCSACVVSHAADADQPSRAPCRSPGVPVSSAARISGANSSRSDIAAIPAAEPIATASVGDTSKDANGEHREARRR